MNVTQETGITMEYNYLHLDSKNSTKYYLLLLQIRFIGIAYAVGEFIIICSKSNWITFIQKLEFYVFYES